MHNRNGGEVWGMEEWGRRRCSNFFHFSMRKAEKPLKKTTPVAFQMADWGDRHQFTAYWSCCFLQRPQCPTHLLVKQSMDADVLKLVLQFDKRRYASCRPGIKVRWRTCLWSRNRSCIVRHRGGWWSFRSSRVELGGSSCPILGKPDGLRLTMKRI